VNVTLTPELEALVERKLGEGGYRDASEVIQEALQLLAERDAYDRLRAELQIGLDQIRRGETVEYTPELMQRLMREAEEDVRHGRPVKDAVRF